MRFAEAKAPSVVGVHVSTTVQVPPEARGVAVAQVPPVTVTPGPLGVIADGVASLAPVFVTVTVAEVGCPTVADPKSTGSGPKVSGPGCTPVPVIETLFDAAVPSGYATVNEPLASAPRAAGIHCRVTVQVPLAAIVAEVEHVPPVTVTPEPAGVIAEGDAIAVPVLVTVTVVVVASPTTTLPSAIGLGLKVKGPGEGHEIVTEPAAPLPPPLPPLDHGANVALPVAPPDELPAPPPPE